MRRGILEVVAVLALVGFGAWAQETPPPPPPGAGPEGRGPQAEDPLADKDIRELVETVRMVRLSKELGLNDEQTVLMVRQYNKYRDRFQNLNQERQKLLRQLHEKVKSDAPDDQVQAALDALMAHDKKVFEERQNAVADAGKNLTAKQRAKLYVFMGEFDQQMRDLIKKARESGGGGRLMELRELRKNNPGRFAPPPPGEAPRPMMRRPDDNAKQPDLPKEPKEAKQGKESAEPPKTPAP